MAIFSDGTPISQWPIAPQHFFDYEILPGENDTGTSFYHSHVGVQAMTANGALIIEDIENPPYMYDDERLIHLTDYFNKSDHAIEMGLTSTPFVWSGETMAVLVNGVGVGIGKQNDTGCELPVIDVEPGKTYRLRFIGATALSHVSLAIEGHANLTIIAADARYTQPYQVSHIQLGTGQRFDVILKTKTIEELVKLRRTQFWLQFETRDRPTVYRGYGSFRYRLPKNEGSSMPKIDENFGPKIIEDYMPPAPASPPLSLPNITYNWLEYALRPLRPNNFPTAAEVTRRIYMTVQQFQSGSIYWAQNGNNWTDTSERTPMLIDLYKRGDAAMPNHTRALENNGWDPETRLWSAKTGEVLEIIIQNTGSLVKNAGALDIHPFHAHAGHFYDIGSGNGTYDPVANEIRLQDYRPVLRDTTMVYRYGTAGIAGQAMSWRGWRLRVSDPGVYIIHCHILQHMVMGEFCFCPPCDTFVLIEIDRHVHRMGLWRLCR
jgi:L-ascorbate oxidase